MRYFTAALAASVLALSTTLVAPSYADPSPSLPDQASDQAVEALEGAQEALQGEGELDPTLALLELKEAQVDLPSSRRDDARAVFARPDQPTDADYGAGADWSPAEQAAAQKVCRRNVCVHYVPAGVVPGSWHEAEPGWAWSTSVQLQAAWNRQVDRLSFRAPVSDGGLGGDSRLDIYLSDVGEYGIFGYAAPESAAMRAPAYLVLDNDFDPDQFGGTPRAKSLKATSAHEFFHAVQFSYDSHEAGWFMESTATWMEEDTFDDVNDNRRFLRSSSLRHPGIPLDGWSVAYGNWVFFQFLMEKTRGHPVRDSWARATKPGWTAMHALTATLPRHGYSLREMFGFWSVANNRPANFYSEGGAFPRAIVTGSWALQTWRRSTGTKSPRLNHLASRNFAFVPGGSLTGSWRLQVVVNGPSGATTAQALIHRRDGSVRRVPFSLNRDGNAIERLPFTRSSVAKVTLNIGNASPSRDGFRFRWSAKAVR